MAEHRTRRGGDSFFGRRKGKPVTQRLAGALTQGLSRYGLDLTQPPPDDLGALFGRPVAGVMLEIGFGGGEHLLHACDLRPELGFIGVEPFVNGIAKLTGALSQQPRDNLRLHDDDAVPLLDWLPQGSLDGIDLFYPDPWPKRRHWKRRFVRPENIERFARVLRPGGTFRFASDIDGYVNWTLLALRRHPAFRWDATTPSDWTTPYDNWPGTRYEAKALQDGRVPAYLTFRRIG